MLAQIEDTPEWLAAPLVGAVIAALAYVSKLLVEQWRAWRTARADEFAQLLALQALLSASRTAFRIQREQADRLAELLRQNHPQQVPAEPGLERLFAALYEQFSSEEADLHLVIRGYTEHALRPLNASMQKWLNADIKYRVFLNKEGRDKQLAGMLNQLEPHLLLWEAKFQAWIPNQPEHALVYLADEERHGLGFPRGIDDTLAHVLAERGVPLPGGGAAAH